MGETEHPDLVKMREREQRAIAQGYTEGDVNHYVQPIIGLLRLKHERDESLINRQFEWAIAHLEKACNAELAWLASTNPKNNSDNGQMLGTVGLKSTGDPELLAALDEASKAARKSSATPSIQQNNSQIGNEDE